MDLIPGSHALSWLTVLSPQPLGKCPSWHLLSNRASPTRQQLRLRCLLPSVETLLTLTLSSVSHTQPGTLAMLDCCSWVCIHTRSSASVAGLTAPTSKICGSADSREPHLTMSQVWVCRKWWEVLVPSSLGDKHLTRGPGWG